jgi:hypothetical protein
MVETSTPRSRSVATVAAAYALLAVWVTWPLAPHAGDHLFGIDPARLPAVAPLGMADHYLNLWILGWVSRALVTAPLGLFDANIFHPLDDALAAGEHILGAAPWFGPIYAASGNPILAVNALILVSFVLGGVGTYLLVLDLTARRAAAFVAGLVFAFAPWRFAWLVHLQLVGVHYFPFVVYFLRRALETGRPRALVGFAVALTLQALTSYYLAYMCAVLAVGVLLWIPRPGRAPTWRRFAMVIVAGGVAAAAIGAISQPYLALATRGIVPAGPDAHATWRLQLGSAQLGEFLVRGSPQYAGLVPVALACLGLARWRAAGRMAFFFLYLVVAGVGLGLGPEVGGVTLPYRWLASWVPGFATLRVPERFVILATLGLAGLAGLGAASVQQIAERLVGARRTAAAAVVTLVVLLGGLYADWVPQRMDLALRAFPRLTEAPSVYRMLASAGGNGAVLEVPPGPGGFAGAEVQARSEYLSLLHRRPLLGGYNGYQPPLAALYADLARRLPDDDALQALVDIVDVGWIVVRTAALAPAQIAAWKTPIPGLEPLSDAGGDMLFFVSRAPTRDWRAHLAGTTRETETFAGVPIAPVPPAGRQALLRVTWPAHVRARHLVRLAVRIRNTTDVPWPGFAIDDAGLVRAWARWLTLAGETVGNPASARFIRDLEPGGTADVAIILWTPRDAGDYTLEVAVGQGEADQPDAWRAGATALTVTVAP